MSHAAIVYAVADDQNFVDGLVLRLRKFNLITARLASCTPRVRAGDSLVVIGVWSPAAAAAGVLDTLKTTLEHQPRRAILCQLDHAPAFPRELDPHIVILGPASTDALIASLESAITLARRRSPDRDDTVHKERGGNISTWALAALGAAFVLGLGGAGVAAFLSAPPKPTIAYERPDRSLDQGPAAGAAVTAPAPMAASGSVNSLVMPPYPFDAPPAAAPAPAKLPPAPSEPHSPPPGAPPKQATSSPEPELASAPAAPEPPNPDGSYD